jgi:hypothetical protein
VVDLVGKECAQPCGFKRPRIHSWVVGKQETIAFSSQDQLISPKTHDLCGKDVASLCNCSEIVKLDCPKRAEALEIQLLCLREIGRGAIMEER